MPDPIIPPNISNGRALWGMHSLWMQALEAWLTSDKRASQNRTPGEGSSSTS